MKNNKFIAMLLMISTIISFNTTVVTYSFYANDYDFWESLNTGEATELLNSVTERNGESFVLVIYRESCHYSHVGAAVMAEYARENNMKIYGLEVLENPDFDRWMDFVTPDMYVMSFPIVIAYNHEMRIMHSEDFVIRTEEFESILNRVGFNRGFPKGILYEGEDASPFNDISSKDTFYDAVLSLSEKGILNGYDDGSFKPDNSITRAEVAALLIRATGLSCDGTEESIYNDVPDDYWGKDYIMAATNAGILNGTGDKTFAPEDNITREQFATILYRYAQYKGYDVKSEGGINIYSYTDADAISDYAVDAMEYIVGKCYMKSKTQATLKPNDDATRAEVAQTLYNFIEAR